MPGNLQPDGVELWTQALASAFDDMGHFSSQAPEANPQSELLNQNFARLAISQNTVDDDSQSHEFDAVNLWNQALTAALSDLADSSRQAFLHKTSDVTSPHSNSIPPTPSDVPFPHSNSTPPTPSDVPSPHSDSIPSTPSDSSSSYLPSEHDGGFDRNNNNDYVVDDEQHRHSKIIQNCHCHIADRQRLKI